MKKPLDLFKGVIEPGRATNTFSLAALGTLFSAGGCIYCAIVSKWFIFALLLILAPVFALVAFAARDVAGEGAIHAAERLKNKQEKNICADDDDNGADGYDEDNKITLSELTSGGSDEEDGAAGHD